MSMGQRSNVSDITPLRMRPVHVDVLVYAVPRSKLLQRQNPIVDLLLYGNSRLCVARSSLIAQVADF